MAQDGGGGASGSEDSGPEAPARGQDRMADGVDAAVDAVQPPALHPPRDPAATEPERAQLRDRHDAVLVDGERGQP